MPDRLITFATLHPSGALTDVRQIALDDVLACPLAILVPEHFRADGSCRCGADVQADLERSS